jgi:glycosyltransferase involved in cell wall biosynthesis
MRIHHVLDNLQVGGAETLVVTLAKAQRQDGHMVAVHGLFGGGLLAAQLSSAEIPVHIHAAESRLGMVWNLYRTLRRQRPDILHCHNIAPTIFGVLAGKPAGVPGFLSTRHGAFLHPRRSERRFWMAARFCRYVAAVSETARENLLQAEWADAGRLTVALNGAAAPDEQPEPEAPAPAGLVLMSVGRLVREKDYPTLLRALALVRRSEPGAELWIAGDGAERPRLEALRMELGLEDSVRLLGRKQNIGYWLSRADLFVLSSVSEGLPVSLLEAMAVGLPAVVTAVGGMPEVLRLSEAGVVVPPSDPQALADAIAGLARRRAEWPILAERARRSYRDHFTVAAMARRYEELYRATLTPRSLLRRQD